MLGAEEMQEAKFTYSQFYYINSKIFDEILLSIILLAIGGIRYVILVYFEDHEITSVLHTMKYNYIDTNKILLITYRKVINY